MNRIDIRFLDPENTSWASVEKLILEIMVKGKTMSELESYLNSVPGIAVEYINPPAPETEILCKTHVSQLSLFPLVVV